MCEIIEASRLRFLLPRKTAAIWDVLYKFLCPTTTRKEEYGNHVFTITSAQNIAFYLQQEVVHGDEHICDQLKQNFVDWLLLLTR